MKTLARYVWAIATLGGILFGSGCSTTSHTARTVRVVESKHLGPVIDFKVVENSTDRELSPQEMTQLREAVTKYLEGEGLMGRKGEYFVRVSFPGEKAGDPDESVVVKLTNIPSSTYTLIAAYPAIGADDYYPSDYFYDYGFTYWDSSYDYYNPPGYYPGDYHRRFPLTPRHPGDIHPGDRDDGPRGTHARNDGKRDRKDGSPGVDHRPRNTGYTPRSPDGDGSRNHARRGDYTPRSTDSGGSRDHAPRDNSPRSSDFGGSRDHGTRDHAPPSSSSSSSSNSYSPPPPPLAPAPAPVSQSNPEVDGNSRNQKYQQN